MLLMLGSIVRPRMLHFTNHMLQVACGNGHVAWCRTAWRSFCRPPRRRAADGSRRPSGSCTSPPAAGATATPYNRLATRSHHAAETRMPRAARSAGFHSHAQGDIERTKRVRACVRVSCDSRACPRALGWACASVGAGGWLPCPWAAARKAAATAARRRTASCLRRAVCPLLEHAECPFLGSGPFSSGPTFSVP